jgi:hypothetical protein
MSVLSLRGKEEKFNVADPVGFGSDPTPKNRPDPDQFMNLFKIVHNV